MENWLKEILERAWGSGVRSSFVLDQNLVPGLTKEGSEAVHMGRRRERGSHIEGPHFEIGGAVFTVWHPKRGVPMHGTTIDVARQFDLVSRLQYMPLAQLENKFQDGASSMCRDRYWLHPKTLCLIYKGTRLQKASNHKA
ncbi:hypothetical protein VNO77_02067 [Canavalia gladiata]|uniref:Uncharacterized protein n=1 Tax=Canavalia gladiata TaxID=3824 RepID=A0AAN9MT24_CANGL